MPKNLESLGSANTPESEAAKIEREKAERLAQQARLKKPLHDMVYRGGGFKLEPPVYIMRPGKEPRIEPMENDRISAIKRPESPDFYVKERAPNRQTERRIERLDEAFDNLLERVSVAPEAKREALRIAIEQMRMIGEQMRNLRQMRNIQELKKQMLAHWAELQRLTEGDPAILNAIQQWGRRFNEKKLVYYDLILEAKREIIEETRTIQDTWGEFQLVIGKILGLARESASGWGSFEHLDIQGMLEENEDYLSRFIESVNNAPVGFEKEPDFGLASRQFGKLGVVLRELATIIYSRRSHETARPAEEIPSLEKDIETVLGKYKEISAGVKKLSRIFHTMKKVKDTNFLSLYNEFDELPAAA